MSLQGTYNVVWTLFIDNNNNDDLQILTLDVNDASTQTVLASVTVHRTDFQTAFQPQNFSASFTATGAEKLEFRVYYACCVFVEHMQTVLVGPLDDGPFGTLFWSDNAHFQVRAYVVCCLLWHGEL